MHGICSGALTYTYVGCRSASIKFGVEAQGKAIMLAMDLNGDESEEELLNQICKEAGVDCSSIVLAWASPPCETYSMSLPRCVRDPRLKTE